MIGSQRMVQPRVHCPRVNKMRKSHLLDPPKTLVPWMGNDLENEVIVNRNKSKYRVVDDFAKSGGHYVSGLLKHFLKNKQIYK